MRHISAAILVCLVGLVPLLGHEGHRDLAAELVAPSQDSFWLLQAGNLHLFFVHFPIALIVMTVVSELFFAFYRRPIFDYAARFMLLSAAILAVPTAISGLLLRYSSTYEGALAVYIWWHMIAGIVTVCFAPYVAYLRETSGVSRRYAIALGLLFVMANGTGLLGGWVAF